MESSSTATAMTDAKRTKEPLPKSEWGPGPWQDEPDRLEWNYKGFDCLLNRNMSVSGSWCGYTALPPGHRYHAVFYDELDIDVHGGLTFSGLSQGEIRHKSKEGGPDDAWWLGFDCSHAFDYSPLLAAIMNEIIGKPPECLVGGHYWTMAEVKAEVERLVDQLV
jgi:hypothetical protein